MREDEGVEFLQPELGPGAGRPEEDVLDTGPHRQVPRWVIGLTGLGIAVAVVLALTLNSSGAPGAAPSSAAAPSPTTTATFSGAPSEVVFPPPDRLPMSAALDGSLTVPHGPIEAAAVGADGSLFLLSPGHLMRVGPRFGYAGDSARDGLGVASDTDWRLVPVGDRLWAVGSGADRTRLVALDATSAQVLHRGELAAVVTDSATLDGHLYLATISAVYDIAPGSTQPTRIRGLAGAASIAADATRHRLLLLTTGHSSAVRAYRPGGPTDVPSVPTAAVVKASVRVAGSAIWLGGFGFDGPVFSRLDPVSLRASASSPLSASLGPGALLAAAGGSVLWVRSGGGGDDLWCVSSSGAIAQHWSGLSGTVVSRPGAAFVAEHGTTVHRLHLNAACRG